VSRYRFVSTMKAQGFPVLAACEVAEVSTSAYYEWKSKEIEGPSPAELDEAYLVNEMHDIHAGSDDTYGSPRMTKELCRRGYCINHKRTERLMRANDIVGVTPRRSIRTTIRSELAPPLDDLVERDFSVGEPNRRYASDITYIATGEGWLYLASVLDIGSRRLAGWAMAGHMRTELVTAALEQALELRGSLAGAICHSDRGSQPNISRASTRPPASALASLSPPGVWRHASTTASPKRSGHRSNASSSTATVSPREPMPSQQSPLGSSVTTLSGSTRASTTSHRSSGRSSIFAVRSKPHNHVSGWRGEGQPASAAMSATVVAS
jgi:hypothetical protein